MTHHTATNSWPQMVRQWPSRLNGRLSALMNRRISVSASLLIAYAAYHIGAGTLWSFLQGVLIAAAVLALLVIAAALFVRFCERIWPRYSEYVIGAIMLAFAIYHFSSR